MMKRTFRFLGVLTMATFAFTGSKLHAQAVDEGDIVLTAYYGFPNLYTTFLKETYANSGYNEQVGGIGPIGFRGEYMATPTVGVGLEFNYANTYIKWSDNVNGPVYNYEVNVPRIRAMARFNFHFGSSDDFDFYAGVGAGFSSLKGVYESNDPSWTYEEVSNPIPIAFRASVGGTYFFTDFLGANLEFGLGGGAIIHAGLSVKL